jgi:hypothetical protein
MHDKRTPLHEVSGATAAQRTYSQQQTRAQDSPIPHASIFSVGGALDHTPMYLPNTQSEG